MPEAIKTPDGELWKLSSEEKAEIVNALGCALSEDRYRDSATASALAKAFAKKEDEDASIES